VREKTRARTFGIELRIFIELKSARLAASLGVSSGRMKPANDTRTNLRVRASARRRKVKRKARGKRKEERGKRKEERGKRKEEREKRKEKREERRP